MLTVNAAASLERAPDHARVGRLRVVQLPGVVHRLAGQAEVRDRGAGVPPGKAVGDVRTTA